MMLGLSLSAFTILHVIISLIAIVAGFVVMFGMLGSKAMPGLTAIFLLFTILTSVTGFMFPFAGLPSWARFIGEALPITHFLRVIRGSLLKGQVLSDMGPNLLALGVFLVVVAAFTLARSRTTLD